MRAMEGRYNTSSSEVLDVKPRPVLNVHHSTPFNARELIETMSTVTTSSTIEEKVAAFEGKAASVKAKAQVQGDYAMKFVCAAMSSE